MTRSSSSTLVNLTHSQMFPSQTPQLTGKRKPEDSNPLLNAAAAKRAKKEAKLGAANKRKLNNDDSPGGLLIVRATDSQPPAQSQPSTTSNHIEPPRFASQPTQLNHVGPSKHPSKKLKANSEIDGRVSSSSKPKSKDRVASPNEDDVEKDVRAMEDEANSLRRQSRAHSMMHPSINNGESGTVGYFQTPRGRSKGKERVIDTVVPLPNNDTPTMERNKQLRSGAMAAITGDGSQPNGSHVRTGHRRKSSVSGRGKRVSTSFETMGVITQPHNSVSESSFYKHLDTDLPESERVRQLLIWCSLRAASSSKSSSQSTTPPPPSLPPLSSEAARLLKSVQDDIVRMLAEKRINLSSIYSSSESRGSRNSTEDLQENEQNLRNRQWEVTYTQQIQKAQGEEEAWKKVSYEYDAYAKKLQTFYDKRHAVLHMDPAQLSTKARGKRRATGDPNDFENILIPHEYEIPPDFHSALALSKSVLGHGAVGDDRLAGGTPTRRGLKSNLTREEMETEIKARLPDMQYKIDQVFSHVNAARTTVNVAEKMLNERFDILNKNLTSRVTPILPKNESVLGSETQLLETYVRGSNVGGDTTSGAKAAAVDLMKALASVDTERPLAMVGDAARRAAREVHRAEETGVSAVGDRRLTGVPSTPSRRPPGTPRRGNTPSRDRL